MPLACEQPATSVAMPIAAVLLASLSLIACGPDKSTKATATPAVLRIGIGGLPSLAAGRGIQQLITNISTEGLARINQEGKLEPWLAENVQRSADGRSLDIQLRPNVKFHDGTPVTAEIVATFLRASLPRPLGAAFEDVESIAAAANNTVQIKFRQPSTFVAEILMDVPVQTTGPKPSATGPYKVASGPAGPNDPVQVVPFDQYYQKAPGIQRISLNPYPSIRAAWADMLRGNLDMLYEVSPDLLDSIRGSTNVSLYTFDRPYQYALLLNTRNPLLKSPKVRQAFNKAIDRDAFVKDGLGGHGTPSAGPVSSHHWAYEPVGSTFTYAPRDAAAMLGKPFTLKCLTVNDAPYDQMALVLKRQLQEIGVTLEIEGVGVNEITEALTKRQFDSILIETSTGWSLFRAYRWWHSKGPLNATGFASPAVDAALERVRHAANDDEYRLGVRAYEQAIADDPPAAFLAWGDRSRAVAKAFDVQAQPGRDILNTLRLWQPSADNRNARNN